MKAQTLGSKQNKNVLMCSKIFFGKSGMFLFIPKILEQNQNFLMCSNLFLAKAKCFYLFQNVGTELKLFNVFRLFLAKAKHFYLIFDPKTIQKCLDLVHKYLKQNITFCCLKKKIWKLNKTISFLPKLLRSERERFDLIRNFVVKNKYIHFLEGVSSKIKIYDLRITLV